MQRQKLDVEPIDNHYSLNVTILSFIFWCKDYMQSSPIFGCPFTSLWLDSFHDARKKKDDLTIMEIDMWETRNDLLSDWSLAVTLFPSLTSILEV